LSKGLGHLEPVCADPILLHQDVPPANALVKFERRADAG
jgi:hypothetical protein